MAHFQKRAREHKDGERNDIRLKPTSFIRFLIPSPHGDIDDLLKEQFSERAKESKKQAEHSHELATGVWNTQFAEIEKTVNDAKAKLDEPNICPNIVKTLHEMDLFRGLKWRVSKDYNAQVVTNAWLKIYEIITQMKMIPPHTTKPIRAFFNAELPGAFTVAVNHYIKTFCPKAPYTWVASSYYAPENTTGDVSTILGDKYGLYTQNPDNWLMDAPSTTGDEKKDKGIARNNGDITNPDNIIDLAKEGTKETRR